jgi:hypothetical protein
MSQKIDFIYYNRLAYEMAKEQESCRPRPAKYFLPEWYKKMDAYTRLPENNFKNKFMMNKSESNKTAKKCVPMLDAMTSGYVIPLWCDVFVQQVKNENDGKFYPEINWAISLDVFSMHGSSSKDIPPPFGYDPIVFKFITWFRIQTPKGYSLMISPPSGHYQLPLHAIPAIVDTDRSVIDSNFPCWIQSGFEGVIKKGTPIAQVTPFKRQNWKTNFLQTDFLDHFLNEEKNFNSNLVNNYIKNIWSKKEYS